VLLSQKNGINTYKIIVMLTIKLIKNTDTNRKNSYKQRFIATYPVKNTQRID
jgi:hypothetical protein